jgi:hypothetical protein
MTHEGSQQAIQIFEFPGSGIPERKPEKINRRLETWWRITLKKSKGTVKMQRKEWGGVFREVSGIGENTVGDADGIPGKSVAVKTSLRGQIRRPRGFGRVPAGWLSPARTRGFMGRFQGRDADHKVTFRQVG